ncbi:spore germination protein [Peribacillus tepidiphilus]|uniref:spore germination protein n=1 Tax=Peribacillus tepidiphilus TaxID=2652445 RepID=UPI0012922D3A|nr:spore germination protein [Peribacillus tepidiphilus]
MPSFFKSKKQKKNRPNQKENSQNQSTNSMPESLNSSLSANLEVIKQKTGNSADVVIRTLRIGENSEIRSAVVYVEGIVDSQSINDLLIESMMNKRDLQVKMGQETIEVIAEEVVALGSVKTVSDWDELFLSLMSGETIILVDGNEKVLSAGTKGGDKRSIQEPGTQMAVRGSRESFTESIRTNTALVRRRVKNPNLWLESMSIGRVSKTDVAIMYINGIAKEEIVEEVRKRLKRIDIDSILESGYIEQLIEDQTLTTFPTLYHTERPDMVAGNLLEGRIAIFVDGTPFVLLAPAVFIQFFQSVEDYYARFDIATAIRFLRILIFFISLIGPAVYIAATTFHQEMIPTQLLIAIAAQREAVPFPAFIEAIIMEVSFEILREAGIRLPKAVGSAVSIVGALVIGQAAVQAGIVSPAMVIVVAITAIASFATPSFAIAISARLIRFLFMMIAATFGFYGIILGIIMMIVHLCSLRSFGVPYMSPLAPFIPANVGDTVIRFPWWALKERPRLMTADNSVREQKNQRPQPPNAREMISRKGDQNDS